jgi:hypothetical protein
MSKKSDLVQKIVEKADSDAAFRKMLKENPAGAIKSLGMSTRPNLNIQVLEETADQAYVVLPFTTKAGAGGELSDDALGAVSGGAAGGCPLCGAG